MPVGKLTKWRPDPPPAAEGAATAVNTEWGCYSSELLPRTKEDRELDAASGTVKGAGPGF